MLKKVTISVFALAAVFFLCCACSVKKAADSGKEFVVIEMFSSEGCSSCVSAEILMNKIIHKADSLSQPIYVLDFHVDYWDYIGWKDTLAIHNNTDRQNVYAQLFKLNSIYTPQAVFNGREEAVGGDEDAVSAAIYKEMQIPQQVSIACKTSKINNSKIQIEYSVTGNMSDCNLNIALVESDLTVKVKKGENAGKTMHHSNAVRAFKSIKMESANGKCEFDLPNVDLSHSKIICYLQQNKGLSIIAATQLTVPQ
jgi:hypothetical protein